MSSITSLMRSGFIAPHTQPSGINKSQSIQFGWTTDILERNPSRFTLDLKPGDVFWTKDKKSPWLQGEDNLTGHWQQFIGQDPAVAKEAEKKVPHLQREKLEQVLKALVREDLEQPGFFIINGTEEIFKNNPKSMALFFKWLMIDLGYVINNNPKYRAYYSMDDAETDDGEAQRQVTLSGLKLMRDGKQTDFLQYTHKTPHFDKGPAINGLFYFQPVWGVEGGIPQVYDIEQYVKDHPDTVRASDDNNRKHDTRIPSTVKVIRGKVPSDIGKEEIHPEILGHDEFQQRYTYTLGERYPNKATLLLVNNKGPKRVAHGTSPLFIPNPDDPSSFDRTFMRYGLHLGKGVYTKTEDNPAWFKFLEDYEKTNKGSFTDFLRENMQPIHLLASHNPLSRLWGWAASKLTGS